MTEFTRNKGVKLPAVLWPNTIYHPTGLTRAGHVYCGPGMAQFVHDNKYLHVFHGAVPKAQSVTRYCLKNQDTMCEAAVTEYMNLYSLRQIVGWLVKLEVHCKFPPGLRNSQNSDLWGELIF